MKIYTVISGADYDTASIDGVYTTKELARKSIEEGIGNNPHIGYCLGSWSEKINSKGFYEAYVRMMYGNPSRVSGVFFLIEEWEVE